MRVYCATCHADYLDLDSIPELCPSCGSAKLFEIAETIPDAPAKEYRLTKNDEVFLQQRGIKR